MVNPISYSPLQGLEGTRGINVLLTEVETAKVVVRGKLDNKSFVSAIEKVTGVVLPMKPWSVAKGKGELVVLWQSPDEWLVRAADGAQGELVKSLRKELGSTGSAVIDISDYYMSATISGKNARDVLEKGCVVDLHDSFPVGYATGTHFEKAVINLYRTDKESYDIIYRRSYAPYLWDHLVHGSKEFG